MALSSSTLQPVAAPTPAPQPAPSTGNGLAASLLSLLLLSAVAGTASRRQLRKIQRKMTWLLIKEKVRSAFSGRAVSDRKVLIYILLGIALLILVIYYPIAALILALVALILLLTGNL